MKKVFRVILGVLLIAVGIVSLLDIAGIATISISLDGWWTLFIIIPALGGLLSQKDKIWNLACLMLGIYLLLAARDIIEYNMLWELFLPTVIVLLGIKFIVTSLNGKKSSNEVYEPASSECMAAFCEKKEDYSGMDLQVAKIGAVFGGAKCNLTDAHFEAGSRLDVFCLFGGADIVVPENVEVKINAFCLFGGISDKRAMKNNIEKDAQLTVNGFCMFGGADIK